MMPKPFSTRKRTALAGLSLLREAIRCNFGLTHQEQRAVLAMAGLLLLGCLVRMVPLLGVQVR